jgi:c-di-GMP-binding flagellar brake protein YcgR
MTSEKPDSYAGQQHELVEDPVKIYGWIERIRTQHALLSVRVANTQDTFNSVILEIDPQYRWLTMDELHPDAGHRAFIAQRRITVFGEFDGVDLRFDCELIEVGTQSNIHFYRVSFPKAVKYYQRRSSYRVRVLRSTAVPVIVMLSGGVAVKFARGASKNITRGQLISECEIRFPDGEKLICAIEARHVVRNNQDQTLLGARFMRLTNVQQRMVNRFIASLERELRRKGT